MEAGRRNILSGEEYTPLFPKVKGGHETVLEDAGVEDTLRLIQRKVPETLNDTVRLAPLLKGGTLDETCSNIWHFVYEHIAYKKDEKGKEQVRRPARAWQDRAMGVDCDCYSTFISSVLSNLGIRHKLRITKYDGKDYYQHIYPIVPHGAGYITIDCVKDEYDSEQPFTAYKDYDMKLEYLNGFNDNHENTDIGDLASTMDDTELSGRFGNWLRNAGKSVSTAVHNAGQAVKHTAQKVGDKIGDGVRFVNRYVNPGTILLRNGFLLAMKVNLMKVAEKLRYAYLTDAQAQALHMDMDALKKIRTIRDRAETVYWQAGGLKENLKKAILGGKGNSDGKVPMNGLNGLGEVFADEQEYNILRGYREGIEGLGELGDPATGTAIAAATGAVSAIAAALSQVKNLFKKGNPEDDSPTPEEGVYQQSQPSITDNGEDLILTSNYETPVVQTNTLVARKPTAPRTTPNRVGTGGSQVNVYTPPPENQAVSATGFMAKSATWVKANPIPTLLIAGAVIGSGYMIVKSGKENKKKGKSLHGFGKTRKRRTKIKTIQF